MQNFRRVLMLSYPFPPAASGGVFRIVRFARYLPEFGWEPIVVTPHVKCVVPFVEDASLEALVPASLRVERTAVWRPIVGLKACISRAQSGKVQPKIAPDTNSMPAKQVVKRSWTTRIRETEGFLFAMPDRHVGWVMPAVGRALKLIRRYRPEVIYSTGPPHSTHLIAWALKRLTGLPVVLDFRDPWAEKEWTNIADHSLRARIVRWLEKRCVMSADRVLLNTEPVRQRFVDTYRACPPERFLVLPNGFDPQLRAKIDRLVLETPAAADRASIRLCHAGSAYGRRDLTPLALAVKQLNDAGHGVSMEQIGPVAAGLKIPAELCGNGKPGAFRLVGTVPHEEALRRMTDANVLLLIQPDNELQVPGKLYEMLPFRKPILTLAGPGATAQIASQYRLGPVVDPKDPAKIAAAILQCADMLRANGRATMHDDAISAFDGKQLTQRLAETFDAVACCHSK